MANVFRWILVLISSLFVTDLFVPSQKVVTGEDGTTYIVNNTWFNRLWWWLRENFISRLLYIFFIFFILYLIFDYLKSRKK